MRFSFLTFVAQLGLLSATGRASYVLKDDYLANGAFFDQFSFWTSGDPTGGSVAFQSRASAQNAGLIRASSSNVYVGVDSSNVTPHGRPSVRLTSNKSYDNGLIILDLQHMPGSICGAWPAFWTVGPNWPQNGEIDIIEGVNLQSTNAVTLHTRDSCKVTNDGSFSGNMVTSNCYIYAPGQASNQGCGISSPNTATYGSGFNANGGGVYATEITDSAVRVFFFPRNGIPSDISNGNPNPSSWGRPIAQFSGNQCNIASNFRGQQIVLDTTFCGSWAGAVWGSSGCASKASSCEAFVANNPTAFKEAYWSINSLRVYQQGGSSSAAQPNPSRQSPAAQQPHHALGGPITEGADGSISWKAERDTLVPGIITPESKTAVEGEVESLSPHQHIHHLSDGMNRHLKRHQHHSGRFAFH